MSHFVYVMIKLLCKLTKRLLVSVQLISVMPHILGTHYTACRLEARARQHRYKTSSIYKHYIEDHQLSQVPDDHIENFSILHKKNDVTDLKIIEAILIKQCNPFINVKYNEFSFFSNLFR